MMLQKNKDISSGFTLMEIIITLLLGSLLAAMMIPYISTNLTRSSEPIHRLQNSLTIQQIMENITADYENGQTLADLKTAIGAEGSNQTNNYGSYHVTANRFIKFVSETEQDITPGVDPEDTLKVTLTDSATPGMPYTTIFTQ